MTTQMSLFEEYSAAHPGCDDAQVIHAICGRLLDEAEAEPPVDVELIASLCGIASVEYRADGPAGMLVFKQGAWVASVSAGDGIERQRFTILHEGGHTFLPDFKRGKNFHRCKGPRTREEQLCDIAAAELLLPRRFFEADLARARAGLDVVEQLSERYMASLQATARRVVDLAVRPMALMVFHLAHKPDDRGHEAQREAKVRLEYAYSEGQLPFPLRHKSASPGTVFHRAWRHEQVDERADIDDFFADPIGPVHVSARRYGDRVLALACPRARGRS